MQVNSFFGSLLSGVSYPRCRIRRYCTCLCLTSCTRVRLYECACFRAQQGHTSFDRARVEDDGEPGHRGKFGMSNEEAAFLLSFPHSAPLFLSLLSLLPFFFSPLSCIPFLHHTTSPLLSPSESVASRWGASKVLIGTTLANGGRLEVACWCELMLSPHPLLAWSGRNKGDEAMAGSWQSGIKNQMKYHWVRETLSAHLYWCFRHKWRQACF